MKIKSKNQSAYGCTRIIPIDGEIKIGKDGVTDVSPEAAQLLVFNTEDWEFLEVPKSGKKIETKPLKVVEEELEEDSEEDEDEEEDSEEEDSEEDEEDEEEDSEEDEEDEEEDSEEDEENYTKEDLEKFSKEELIEIIKESGTTEDYSKISNNKKLLVGFILKNLK